MSLLFKRIFFWSIHRKNSACKNKSLQGHRTRHITLQIRGLLDKVYSLIKQQSLSGYICNASHVNIVNGSFTVGGFFYWQTDRDVLMRLVLQVKGVISVTFDMNKKRCFLRVKPDIKPEVFWNFLSCIFCILTDGIAALAMSTIQHN